MAVELVRGDITEQDTDVVVNAANSSLLGGGGVAFPAISTGIYRWPVESAARIALATVAGETPEGIDVVRFVLFDQATYDAFAHELG